MSMHVSYVSHVLTMTAPVHKSLQEPLQLTPHSWSSLHPLLHILPRQTSWQSAKRRLIYSTVQSCRRSGSAEDQVHARVGAHRLAQLAHLQAVGTRQIHILAAQQARRVCMGFARPAARTSRPQTASASAPAQTRPGRRRAWRCCSATPARPAPQSLPCQRPAACERPGSSPAPPPAALPETWAFLGRGWLRSNKTVQFCSAPHLGARDGGLLPRAGPPGVAVLDQQVRRAHGVLAVHALLAVAPLHACASHANSQRRWQFPTRPRLRASGHAPWCNFTRARLFAALKEAPADEPDH